MYPSTANARTNITASAKQASDSTTYRKPLSWQVVGAAFGETDAVIV